MQSLTTEEVMKEFEAAEAILRGHFVLSSGLHSDTYLQCARALMDTSRAQRLCGALAQQIKQQIDINSIDMVASPAMGGLLVGYEVARQLDKPYVFCERVDGKFALRRGFSFEPNTNILLIEDVVTTGLSSKEAIHCIESAGGKVVAEGSLVNRNGNSNPLEPLPLISLLPLEVATFDAENIPKELSHLPAEKPGSRFLQKAS